MGAYFNSSWSTCFRVARITVLVGHPYSFINRLNAAADLIMQCSGNATLCGSQNIAKTALRLLFWYGLGISPINVYSRAWAHGRMVFTVLVNIILCPFSHILVANGTSSYVLVQDVSTLILSPPVA
jgi:hypothetical protein